MSATGDGGHERGVFPDVAGGWRIGDIEIDLIRAQVRRGGEPIGLDRSGFDVLCCLARQAGQIVAKDTLLAAGWPGRVVSDNSLMKAIGKLRRVLGDEQAELIRVVHGYGYRLVGSVEELAGVAPTDPMAPAAPAPEVRSTFPRHPAALLALLALAMVVLWRAPWTNRPETASRPAVTSVRPNTGEDVIVVLPFRDLSATGTLGLFADGVANHLRDKLSRVPKIRPINRAESVPYRDDRRDPAAIAHELGANLIVTGTVAMLDGHLRVQLNLLDTSARIPALERSVERLPTDQATVLDELTTALLAGIGERPGGLDPRRGGSTNPEAYQAFLRASTLFAGNNEPNSQRRTLAILEEALQLDPDYADAWYMYAGILGGGGYWADSVEELVAGRKRALTGFERGIALAPGNPDDYLALSELKLLYFYDWEGAWADLEAAERLTPGGESGTLLVWKARYMASAGRIDEAIALDARAIALDPQAGARRNQGWHYLAKRDTRNARAVLMLELPDMPENPHVNFYLALCDIFEGNPDAALPRLEHSSTLFRLVGTAVAQHELGDRIASDTALKKLTDQFAIPDGYWIGAVHAWRGEIDEAFHWFERAMHNGDNNVMYLPFDPLIENVRGDPRYRQLLATLNLPRS